MDIRRALLNEHSKRTKDRIVAFVDDDPSRFAALLHCAQAGDKRLAELAVWPLGEVMVLHPELLRGNWPQLIKLLTGKNHHPAVYRNLLRALQYVDLPERYVSKVIDLCFEFIRSEHMPVAVRANAITVAARLCAPHPELTKELKLLLDELSRYPLQAALRVRVRDTVRWLG